jgi:hypothetical protein
MKTLLSLPTIANVAAGNSVSINMPVGNVYERVFLEYSGVTLAQLKNIKLELNTLLVSEWADGTKVESIDAHYDRATTSGYLVFNFTRPELHNLQQRRFFGLDTSVSQGISLCAITLDVDSGATAPVLKAYAEKSSAVQGVPNFLTKIRRFILPVSATGQFDIDNIPRPIGASIAAIHLFMADGVDADALCDITKADLIVDNVSWHDVGAATAAAIQETYKRVPQTTDATVIDMILDNDIQQALPLTQNIKDMRVRATASGTGQVEVIVEYIDQYGQGRF